MDIYLNYKFLTMDALLSLQNLKKYYATQKAVDDISFDIERGSIFGLLGPNGAGNCV